MSYITYYKKLDNTYRIYNNKEFEDIPDIRTKKIAHFALIKPYEATDEDLKQFYNDLQIWRDEIYNSTELKGYDYFKSFKKTNGIFYQTHSSNIQSVLKYFTKEGKKSKFDIFEPIELYEVNYIEKCYNAGVVYHKDGIYKDAITYDFKMFYPRNMADNFFYIPKSKGRVSKINKLYNKYNYGIYNIKVLSNDPKFNKIFSYSHDNYYTHYSLNFIMSYNKNHNNSVKLKLLSNECLRYEDLIPGGSIFYKWFINMKQLKNKHPKNRLIKNLTTKAWGTLQKTNKNLIKTEEEINNEDLEVGFDLDPNENRYYITDIQQKNSTTLYYLVDLSELLYRYPLRLKCFLTDFGRVKIAKQALENIDNVIRICTDSITYDKPINLNVEDFIIETDKTGHIQIEGMKKPTKLD